MLVRTATVLALLPTTMLLAFVDSAGAAPTGTVAEERLPFGSAGVVGVIAVILGAGGVLAGLLRRRRILNRAAAAPSQPQPSRTETPV